MSDQHHVPLPGSARSEVVGGERVGPVDPDARIDLTVILRRRSSIPRDLVEGPDTVAGDEFAQRYGADPADIDRVTEVFEAAGVRVTDVHAGSRRLTVSGSATAVTGLFGTDLNVWRSTDPVTGNTIEHRGRTGELGLPPALDGIVIAVLGLDDRPQARAHFRPHDVAAAHAAYDPPALAKPYNFPPDQDGTGQVAAIIELGGGFGQDDLDAFFGNLNIPTPNVTAVGVDGGSNVPGQDPGGADGEVLLDIEVLGALAPGAGIVVYFSPNTDQGFVDAITTAVHATPTPAVVSISWGASEDEWTPQARHAMDQAFADAAALGVTITAAAGDDGSGDRQDDGRPHADFPASSPHVLACGGTTLRLDAAGHVASETVWNDGPGGGATGGGVSVAFPVPVWQNGVGVPNRATEGGGPGRGEPDVSAVADPVTGYKIRVDGREIVIGGTSAVAPLWAALICRFTQALGRGLGLMQPTLYSGVTAGKPAVGFRDVVQGDNGAYKARPGWDACTGLGVPDGVVLLDLLTKAGPDTATGADGAS